MGRTTLTLSCANDGDMVENVVTLEMHAAVVVVVVSAVGEDRVALTTDVVILEVAEQVLEVHAIEETSTFSVRSSTGQDEDNDEGEDGDSLAVSPLSLLARVSASRKLRLQERLNLLRL